MRALWARAISISTLTLVMTVAVAVRAEATTIYAFNGLSLSPTTTTANATSSSFHFSSAGGAICISAIGNPGPSCGGFGDSTDSFTVTPFAGSSLSVTGFSFEERNIDVFGPTSFSVFTSADGFTSAILSGALGASAVCFTNHSTSL